MKPSAVVIIGVRLGPHSAEETPAYGQVQKKITHLHRRAWRMGRGCRLDYLPGEDPYADAEGIFRTAFAGRERHGGDGPDGVQCLAAEAQGD